MSERFVHAKVESATRLDSDEKLLLEEIAGLRKDAFENIRTSFRQLLTLNTAVIGLYVGLLKTSSPLEKPTILSKILVISSFLALFTSLFLAIFGQITKKIDLRNLDVLTTYRMYRDATLKSGYKIYIIAICLFSIGLLTFTIDLLVRLIGIH